mmetsp:Transcript_41301/g.39772  ORF Transcript_41301/g.39772 Transcript_41301/m.39772 type:complete len:82 (+) Transcript_41301:103-348(+)
MLKEPMMNEIKECFDIFDKDKDGLITYIEMGTLLRWLNFNPTERELKEFQGLYDQTNQNTIDIKTVNKIVDIKLADPDTFE